MISETKVWELIQRATFEDDDLPPPGWKSAAISIHDHWLSEDEAARHWMCYGGATADSEKAEYLEKEKAFTALFEMLRRDYGLCEWHNQGEADSESTVRERCIESLKETNFAIFKCNSLRMVVLGNYDMTFPVFMPPEVSLEVLRCVIESHGLHLLEQFNSSLDVGGPSAGQPGR